MDIAELVEKRYSVRAYTSDPVEEKKLDWILQAAALAPTSANMQGFKVLVIHTADRRQELNKIYKAKWFTEAPLLLAVVGIANKSWTRGDGKNYNDVDCAIVMDHMVLAAMNEGLGTCWVSDFDIAAARSVLKIPKSAEVIAFTPLGYAAEEGSGRPRIVPNYESLVMYENWTVRKKESEPAVAVAQSENKNRNL